MCVDTMGQLVGHKGLIIQSPKMLHYKVAIVGGFTILQW